MNTNRIRLLNSHSSTAKKSLPFGQAKFMEASSIHTLPNDSLLFFPPRKNMFFYKKMLY